ncbi:MAG: replicative DNA helicase [Clostridia bacterium]|nr:replicative DNA helicase [Clostridia bacterium]
MSDKTTVLPNNLEAEQALLGCMFIDNDILAEVIDKLDENDFYQESHKLIMAAVQRVFNRRKPIDMVTLTDDLEKEGNLAKVGGIEYLIELTQKTPTAANFRYYLDIVKRDSINRELIRAARNIIENSSSSDDGLKSIQYAEKLVYDISKTGDSSTMHDIRESNVVEEVLDKFQTIATDKDALRGITTGIPFLNKLTNGLQRSDLIVIAARPGMGKTSLAMNIVEAAAYQGNVCAVFSLEMPENQIVQRLLCSAANVSMTNALSGKLTPNDWKALIRTSEELKKLSITIDDSARITPAEILSKCRRIKAKNGGKLDLVMIDYIQLMSSGSRHSEENRTREIAQITGDLKIMAKELNVPVIALSQLRRIEGEPALTDLRESGAIEQDADMVIFINRPDVTAKQEDIEKKGIVKGMADLIVAKHRNGELGRCQLRFKGEYTKFVTPDPDELRQMAAAKAKKNKQPKNEETEDEEVPEGSFSADGYDGDIPFE